MSLRRSFIGAGLACALLGAWPEGFAHPGHLVGGGFPGAGGPSGWDSRGIRVLAHLPVSDFGNQNVLANDCWGYVSPTGREYALIGLDRGIGVVEVTDPVNPTIVGFVAHGSSLWHDVKVIGEYAYAVTEASGSGIRVIDLTQVDTGVVTVAGTFDTGPTHNIAANPVSGHLYRAGGGADGGDAPNGLRIYSTTDPTSPEYVGLWDDFYVHDVQVVTYESGPYAGREIAFCCTGNDRRLRIVDVTDKAGTFEVGSVAYTNGRYSHQGWLSEDLRYFYLNDELDEVRTGVDTTTRIIDVSDIANPVEAGVFTNGNGSIDHNLYTHDGLIFASNYRSGLRIFDAADPLNPTELAYLDTFMTDDGAQFDGVWSNYPYLPSGIVLVSDIQQGLIIAEPFLDRLDFDLSAPSLFDPAGGTLVHAQITGVGVDLDMMSVTLHIDDGDIVREIPAQMVGMGDYDMFTPPLGCADTVRYWVSARSTDGRIFYGPASAPRFAVDVPVANGLETDFQDDFETDQGWSVVDGPLLTGGTWQRGVPQGGGLRGDPQFDFDGSGSCFLTANAEGNTDVDDDVTTLTSPLLDASGGGVAFITYAAWFVNTISAGVSDDVMTIEISDDDGANWTLLETIGPATVQAWSVRRHRIDEFVQQTDQTRVRFTAGDLNSASLVEAAIDAVRVERLTCCPTDYNKDGASDILDLLTYLTLWFPQDPAAEFTGDWPASVDVLDLLAFLAGWFGGC